MYKIILKCTDGKIIYFISYEEDLKEAIAEAEDYGISNGWDSCGAKLHLACKL